MENKFYTQEWFNKCRDGEIKPYSNLEAAGDAEECADEILDLLKKYTEKHGEDNAHSLAERIGEFEIGNGLYLT